MEKKKGKRECKIRDHYYIRVESDLVEVTREVYLVYYQSKRREKYLEERDRSKGLSFFNEKEEENICDLMCESVEETVISDLENENLMKAIATLSQNDFRLIKEIYYNDRSERELAKMMGVSKTAIGKRKKKILEKLKKMLEEG